MPARTPGAPATRPAPPAGRPAGPTDGTPPARDLSRLFVGLVVVTLGVLFLLDSAGALDAGRWPEGTGEVVLDEKTADKAGYLIGEKVNIVSSGAQPRIEAMLVGIVTMAGGTAGASLSIFDTAEARTLFMEGKDAYNDIEEVRAKA